MLSIVRERTKKKRKNVCGQTSGLHLARSPLPTPNFRSEVKCDSLSHKFGMLLIFFEDSAKKLRGGRRKRIMMLHYADACRLIEGGRLKNTQLSLAEIIAQHDVMLPYEQDRICWELVKECLSANVSKLTINLSNLSVLTALMDAASAPIPKLEVSFCLAKPSQRTAMLDYLFGIIARGDKGIKWLRTVDHSFKWTRMAIEAVNAPTTSLTKLILHCPRFGRDQSVNVAPRLVEISCAGPKFNKRVRANRSMMALLECESCVSRLPRELLRLIVEFLVKL